MRERGEIRPGDREKEEGEKEEGEGWVRGS